LRIRRRFEDKLGIESEEDPYSNSESNFEDDLEPSDNTLMEDFQLVRATLRDAIRTNKDVIDTIKTELYADPTPRMTEAVARLLESLTNTSLQLIQASKTIAEIAHLNKNKEEEEKSNMITIQNAIITGSLEDALKLGKHKQEALPINTNNGTTKEDQNL